MSQVHHTHQQAPERWNNDGLDRGVVDLYARRMAVVAVLREEIRQEELERIVVTQPFGRPFTAQPSFPPDPPETQSGFAGLRKKLSGAAPGPRRKLATS
ncbi:MAG TPA: hypothetical protein VFP05_06420 [Thermomicrobiales bacterium]|nr:hypothetical protein [Thermomicrobiales bacterium]